MTGQFSPARAVEPPSRLLAPSLLLQRKCACGGHTPAGETCTTCAKGNTTRGAMGAGVMTHTAVSRDGDVETETQALPRSPPASPLPANDRCAVASANFTSIPTGTLVPTITGGRLQAPFVMRASFQAPIPCTCGNGEYRQYVRGSFTSNGNPVTHLLGPGRPLSATTFQEDGDVAAGTVYGYRSILGTGSRFKPDQATGCDFEGEDAPGISGPSTARVAMTLDFRGDLIDTTAANRVVATKSWSVAGSGVIP